MEKVGGCKKSIGVGGKKLNKKRRCARAREFPCVYQRKYLSQFKSMRQMHCVSLACLNLQQTESVAYQFENEKKYERKVKKEKRKSEKEKVRG